ncbi:MAG: hypothetical protein NVSMB9_21820 [Isosphaeraceae bacterium]
MRIKTLQIPQIDPKRNRVRTTLLFVLITGLSAGSGGCQTWTHKLSDNLAPSFPARGSSEVIGPKTDFHRQISPEQQFNVHMELAKAYEAQAENEAAYAEYQKAADVSKQQGNFRRDTRIGSTQVAMAHRKMAGALDRMGRFAQSESHYSQALKLAPDDPKVWNDVGYSYYLQNRWNDAEGALRTADSLDPNNPRILTNLGLTLAAVGKEKEALAALSRAGGPAAGHANLGFILAAKGQTEQSRKHYQSALALQPQLAPARQAMVKIDRSSARKPSATLVQSEPDVSKQEYGQAKKPLGTLREPLTTRTPTAVTTERPPVANVQSPDKLRDPKISTASSFVLPALPPSLRPPAGQMPAPSSRDAAGPN